MQLKTSQRAKFVNVIAISVAEQFVIFLCVNFWNKFHPRARERERDNGSQLKVPPSINVSVSFVEYFHFDQDTWAQLNWGARAKLMTPALGVSLHHRLWQIIAVGHVIDSNGTLKRFMSGCAWVNSVKNELSLFRMFKLNLFGCFCLFEKNKRN